MSGNTCRFQSGGLDRWRAMTRIRMHVATALKSPETVKACAVLDHIHAAMVTLDELPVPALEALRDELEDMAKTRTGARGALKRAWFDYIEEPLDAARRRDRQEFFGMHKEPR
jgi:hypothetical protein